MPWMVTHPKEKAKDKKMDDAKTSSRDSNDGPKFQLDKRCRKDAMTKSSDKKMKTVVNG